MSQEWLRNHKLMITQLKPPGAESGVLHEQAAGKRRVSGKQLEREKRGAKGRAKSDCRKRKGLAFKSTSCVSFS